MTKWVGVLGGGAAAAVVGAGLYVSGILTPTQTPPEPEPQQAVAPLPDDSGAGTAPVEATPEPEAPAQPEVTEAPSPPEVREDEVAADAQPPEETDAAPVAAPTFDIVRIEPDGSTLIAGQGVAESAIRVLLDGKDIAEAQADRDGKFVSLLAIAPSDQPRLMSLIMSVDGAEYPSDTEIIVAPFGPEPKLAEAESEAEAEAEAEAKAEAVADPAPAKEEAIASVSEPIETATDPVDDTPSTPTPVEADTPKAEASESTDAPESIETADADPATEEVAALEPSAGSEPAPEQAPDVSDTPEPSDTAEAMPVAEPGDQETPETPEKDAPKETVTETAESEPAKVTPGETAETSEEEVLADTGAAEEPPQPDTTEAPEPTEVSEPTEAAEPTEVPEPADEAKEAPPTLLASDEEGVRVLQGPDVLDSVAIDTISYDEAGDVALAGRGATSEEGGFVRIYLDNTPVTSSRIREDGSWRVNLPEVDKGVYTLRVDEVDEDGTVKSRAETPFQREDRETLERVAGDEGDAPLRVLTVQPGNTLWQIARDRYGEGLLYVRVFEANKGQIRDPDLIYPGQVFDLPEAAE